MRFREFKLTEEDQKAGFYTVGDSHAVGLAHYAGKPWVSKAKNGTRSTDPMHKAAIASIPKGSTVAISLGANDAQDIRATPSTIASNVADVVNAAKQQGLKVHFLLFPVGTQPNGEVRSKVRDAIKSAVDVPVIDLEGSRLVDGIHADSSAYRKAASSIASAAPLGNAAATPGKLPTKDKGQAGQTAEFVLDTPKSRRGPEVADVQKALIALGYPLPKHGVDGIRGPETIEAVKKFQQANNLEVDGDPGPETISKLNAVLKSKPDVAKTLTKSTGADVKQSSRVGQTYSTKPVAYDAVTKGKVGEVLNFVAGPESRGYYDMMFGGSRKPEILKMTIADANKFQVDWGRQAGSSAMGRYQIMGDNTIPYARKAGLNPNTELFSPENQDKMGIVFLQEKGLDQWLNGKMTDEQFLEGLARVWAGLPAPSKNGDSYYGGVGLNKARTQVSMNSALEKLQDIKTA